MSGQALMRMMITKTWLQAGRQFLVTFPTEEYRLGNQ